MEPVQLFFATLDDLKVRITPGTEYNLVRASGLLRQLYLDQTPLINLVNRQTKLKLSFEIKKWPDSIPQIGKLEVQSPEPDDQMPRKAVDFKTFLSTKTLFYHEHVYTVKDIIKAVSNVQGGVHKGVPKNDKERYLEKDQFTSFKFGIEGSAPMDLAKLLIKPIAQVTLRSLQPIKKGLQASNKS